MYNDLYTTAAPHSHRALEIGVQAREQEKQMALLNGLYLSETHANATRNLGRVARIIRSLALGLFA